MTSPFTPEQETRLAAVIASARAGGIGEAQDPDAALRLSCLHIIARLAMRGDPRVSADVLVTYVRTGQHRAPEQVEPA